MKRRAVAKWTLVSRPRRSTTKSWHGLKVQDKLGNKWHCYGDGVALGPQSLDNLERLTAGVAASLKEVLEAGQFDVSNIAVKYKKGEAATTVVPKESNSQNDATAASLLPEVDLAAQVAQPRSVINRCSRYLVLREQMQQLVEDFANGAVYVRNQCGPTVSNCHTETAI